MGYQDLVWSWVYGMLLSYFVLYHVKSITSCCCSEPFALHGKLDKREWIRTWIHSHAEWIRMWSNVTVIAILGALDPLHVQPSPRARRLVLCRRGSLALWNWLDPGLVQFVDLYRCL